MTFVRLFVQTAFFAIGEMWSNKVRALLTTLGIIIGVWAITSTFAAAGGLKGFVLDEFQKFGATKVFIWGERPDELREKLSWSDVKIAPDEVEALRSLSQHLDKVSIVANERVTVRYEDKVQPGVTVTGIEPDWHDIEQRFVTLGRPFNSTDNQEQLQVCLINEHAIDELRLENQGIGEYILLNNRRFYIVGLVESKEMSAMFGGGEAQSEIFVPFQTLYKLDDWLWTQAVATMTTPEVAEDAKQEIRFILRSHRQLPPDWPDTFDLFQMTQAVENFNQMSTVMGMAAGVLVSISLLVGGVGIMNIMLVSVSERTREIGLRKALGARPAVVLVQFLVEAVILCLAGGLIGLVIGQITSLLMKAIPNFPLSNADIPAFAIVLALGFSGVVGVVFGMWPAVKAARLDPIEALRHE